MTAHVLLTYQGISNPLNVLQRAISSWSKISPRVLTMATVFAVHVLSLVQFFSIARAGAVCDPTDATAVNAMFQCLLVAVGSFSALTLLKTLGNAAE